MKIVIACSKESISSLVKNFFNYRGHEVLFIMNNPSKEGDISFEDLEKNGLIECDAVINMSQKMVLSHKLGTEQFQKEFHQTRIEPTERLQKAILSAKVPPKVFISFSSVGIYPKEEATFHREETEPGTDPTAELVKKWESAAQLPDGFPCRQAIFRLGLIISKYSGLLPHLIPFFRFGFGSTLGKGVEAFPWIYLKDLWWLLEYAILCEDVKGVYNTVAPQVITSKGFSQALSYVLKKPAWFKFPRKFFIKRLGDTAEIVFSRSIVYPSRLLKSGFEFRYPAIYPALVDCISHRAFY